MNTQELEEIVILDDEADLVEVVKKNNQKEQSNIFVFDDDQNEAPPQPQKPLEDNFETTNTYMSPKQYKKRCSELSDLIIMQNLSNFANVKKPQKNYFKEAKDKRKSFEYQSRKSLRPMQQIIIEPKQHAIKVNFQPETSKSIKTISSIKEAIQHYEFGMIDQIVESKKIPQIQKVKQNKIDLGGMNFKRKSELKIEEDKEKNLLKVSNFREFLYSQLKPNYNIFIEIKKTEDGFINSTYKFYFQQTKKIVLSCEKQGFSKYVFSTSEIHISEDHISYLGKMESSFFGGQFLLYDSGEDCSKTKMMQNYKKQLGYITYSKEDGEPRKIQTLVTTCDNSSTDFTIVDKESNILSKKWSNGNKKNLCKLVSKNPSYDPQDCCYKMDFKGIAGIPSIKNFILQNEDYPDALIFGRKDKDEYIMRVRSPFSIVQAAAIAMSSIHHKFI